MGRPERVAAGVAAAALALVVASIFFATRDGDHGGSRPSPAPNEPPITSRPADAAPRSDDADTSTETSPAAREVSSAWPAVTGRLFDAATGSGIAGARVLRVASQLKREPDRLVATSDATGEFSFAPESIEPALYAFRADGYFPARGIGAAPGDRVEMALARGATVRARVVELRSRKGIAEAEIAIEGRERIRSDAEGRFAFVAGPRTTRVAIEARGHESAAYEEVVPAENDGEIEFALAASDRLHFRVTDAATGRPVENVSVGENDAERTGDGIVRAAVRFRNEVARADVTAPGYAKASVSVPVGARGSADEPIEVALEPAAAILGRVVDEAGRPIAGATLFASGANLGCESWSAPVEAPTAFATTGEDGRFVVEGLSSRAAYAVRATHPSYRPALNAGEPIAFTRPERRSVLDIVLAAAEARSGIVRRRDDGSPVAGAAIEARAFADHASATTSGDGAFAIVTPEGATSLEVRAHGLVPALVPLSESPGEVLEISLESGLAIEGVVLDPDGLPAAGCGIRSFLEDFPEELARRGINRPYIVDWPDVVADAEGRFRIAGLVPGSRFRLHPWRGPLGGLLVSPSIEGPIEAGTVGLVYRLEPAEPRSGIRVRTVSRVDDRPVADVRAAAAPADPADESGSRSLRPFPGNGTGEIFVPLRPDRAVSLVVFARGFRPSALEPQSVSEGEVREVRVALSPAGSISGTLRHEDGRAAAGFDIGIRPLDLDGIVSSKNPWTKTRSDGRFSFPGLFDGEYRVLAFASTGGTMGGAGLAPVALRPDRIQIADGEDVAADVIIEEEPGALVEGRIELPPEDAAYSRVTIRLRGARDDDRDIPYSCRLAPNADRFRFDAVRAGTYSVLVECHVVRPGGHSTTWNYRPSPARVTVPDEGAVTLDIRAEKR